MNAPGGIERVVSNLMREWEKNYEIALLVKDEKSVSFYDLPEKVQRYSIEEPLQLNMHNRKQRIIEVFKNAVKSHKKLKKALKEIEYDYVYTTTPLNSLEVYCASKNCERKMIISEHASAYAVNKVYRVIKKIVYPKAKCIVVPNKMDCSVYEGWGCTTHYIPHYVTFQATFQNSLNTKIALNVGRYTADKRQKELIQIWANIEDKNGWNLWIVGKGEEENNLREEIEKNGVEDSVRLVPYTRDISEIYGQASLFLFTSWMEGFGMVLLEAMSFGIPCISYDCPSGPRDVVKDGENGYLIPNSDKEQFSKVLCRTMHLPDTELRALGAGAFETVKKWDNGDISKCWNRVFSN